MRPKLLVGNWKMNGTRADLPQIDALVAAHPTPKAEMILCPPATLLGRAAERAQGHALAIGAQDCHGAERGPHTGDISPQMIVETGATHVILGHSERRAEHGESDSWVRAKARAARAAGLTPIVCAGEDLHARQSSNEIDIVTAELLASLPDETDGTTIVAYEPIWAIGSGIAASTEDIAIMHGAIRDALTQRFGETIANQIRILYGGSVKSDNASSIFAVENVDGALVGGASLLATDFGAILTALEAAT